MVAQVLISSGVLLVTGGIAWGVLRERVKTNAENIATIWNQKQNVNTCTAHHAAIMRELDSINKKLDNLKE